MKRYIRSTRTDKLSKSENRRYLENKARRESAKEDTRSRNSYFNSIKNRNFTIDDIRNLNSIQWNKLTLSDLRAISNKIGLDQEMYDRDMPEVLDFWTKRDYIKHITEKLK